MLETHLAVQQFIPQLPVEALRCSRSPMDCLTDALATGDGNLDLPELA